MRTYEASCLFDGWRIDRHTVKAASPQAAKDKVRRKYKRARSVTGVTVRERAESLT